MNPQTMSHPQKIRLWKEHKQEKFKEISGDPCQMWNYFYNNNDVFKFISQKDHLEYSFNLFRVMDKQANIYFGCFIGVILIDRLILNRFFPKIRFQEWRFTANLIKYAFWPFAIFKQIDYYMMKPYREKMFEIQQRYRFGFQDYVNGNRIFERALAVNRLQQLLQKRQKFDWSGVPQLQ